MCSPNRRAVVDETPQWLALLGQRDEPTDAIEDYCRILAGALHKKGCSLQLFRIDWARKGWQPALRDLRKQTTGRTGAWALVQYTGLAWSRRGFPFRLVPLVRMLKRAGMKVALVFHDPEAFPGRRLRDRVRRQIQLAVMRRSAKLADKIVSTIPAEQIPWMQNDEIRAKISVIPVGSNFTVRGVLHDARAAHIPSVIVFGLSPLEQEVAMIAQTLLRAAAVVGEVRLIIFGRGARRAEPLLQDLLRDSRVHLEAFGILADAEAAQLLANADLQLFIRSGLSARRGSAIAGITCGLPIVGYSSGETAFPITEAGVRLVPVGDAEGLVRETVAVLRDETLRQQLRERSLLAAQQYFSWDYIATRYMSALA